jgi:hypothetical protein
MTPRTEDTNRTSEQMKRGSVRTRRRSAAVTVGLVAVVSMAMTGGSSRPDADYDLLRASLTAEQHPSLSGRFDLARDGTGPARLLEYNADEDWCTVAYLADPDHPSVLPATLGEPGPWRGHVSTPVFCWEGAGVQVVTPESECAGPGGVGSQAGHGGVTADTSPGDARVPGLVTLQ